MILLLYISLKASTKIFQSHNIGAYENKQRERNLQERDTLSYRDQA